MSSGLELRIGDGFVTKEGSNWKDSMRKELSGLDA